MGFSKPHSKVAGSKSTPEAGMAILQISDFHHRSSEEVMGILQDADE